MRTVVKGKNIDVSEADRRHAEDKMRRLERLLDERSEALVELSLERHRSAEASHIVEVTLVVDGKLLRGEAGAATFRTAVDQVIDKLERQAVDLKERPRERERDADRRTRSDADDTSGSADEAPRRVRIVKTKRFAIEPMFEEDAVGAMEELGHSFFIFVNAENERLAVLYRRTDGDYGLIEPTVGGLYTTDRGAAGDGGRHLRTTRG